MKNRTNLKRIAVFLCITFLSACLITAHRDIRLLAAPNTPDVIVMHINSANGLVNDKLVSTPQKLVPFSSRGIVFVPLSFIAEALQAELVWDAAERTATLAHDGVDVVFTIEQATAKRINAFGRRIENINLDRRVILHQDSTYVDLNGLAKALDLSAFEKEGLIVIGQKAAVSAISKDAEQTALLKTRCLGLEAIGTEERLLELTRDLWMYDDEIVYEEAEVDFDAGRVTSSKASVMPSTGSNRAQLMPRPTSAPTGAADTSASAEEAGYSTTNVQVAGVDEGDVIKTDGEYIYYLSNQKVSVVKANPPDKMSLTYTLTFDDNGFTPVEVYIDGNRAVVVGRHTMRPDYETSPLSGTRYVPSRYYFTRREATRVYVFDITDKKQIQKLREVDAEGSYLASRKIGDAMYIVTNQHLNALLTGRTEDETGPYFYHPQYRDTVIGEEPIDIGYDKIFCFPNTNQQSYLTVTGFRLNDNQPVSVSTYFGAGSEVYVSADNLYVAARQYNYNAPYGMPDSTGPATALYKFALQDGVTSAAGQGSVPGTILNQFSMDEYDGYFRIATTSYDGRYYEVNNLYILDGSLSITGRIEDIAPEERIYSVRFMGSRGYMVTFKQVDPLFAFDLSDPYAPKILGALKIPGYSDYLHPYDENHLIGFGKDTVSEYETAYYQGMKLSMFDISDITQPKELFTEIIGDRGTYSELLDNHRALLFDREKNILAFPVMIMQHTENKQPRPTEYGNFSFQGVRVYGIDMEKGFIRRGDVTHLSEEDMLKASAYGSDSQKYIQRMLYIGDTLYTASNAMIQANRLNDMKTLGQVSLDEYTE